MSKSNLASLQRADLNFARFIPVQQKVGNISFFLGFCNNITNLYMSVCASEVIMSTGVKSPAIYISIQDVKNLMNTHNIQDVRKFLKYTVAHELGHLDYWNSNKATSGFVVDDKLEAVADAFSINAINMSIEEYHDCMDIVASGVCNAALGAASSNKFVCSIFNGVTKLCLHKRIKLAEETIKKQGKKETMQNTSEYEASGSNLLTKIVVFIKRVIAKLKEIGSKIKERVVTFIKFMVVKLCLHKRIKLAEETIKKQGKKETMQNTSEYDAIVDTILNHVSMFG